jgi:hypothetical protein
MDALEAFRDDGLDAEAAAVSSQPIALSGKWRLRMFFGAISSAVLMASSEILTE